MAQKKPAAKKKSGAKKPTAKRARNKDGRKLMTSKKNMTTNRKPRRIDRNKGGRKKGKKTVTGYYIADGKIRTLYDDHWSTK